MTERIEVASTADIGEGERQLVPTTDGSIGVLNVEGEYFALKNECPHQGGPVCTGNVFREMEGVFKGAGEHVERRFSDVPTVACPFHGWEFNLRTGEHVGDDNYAVETYDVAVEDGTVYVVVP